MSKTQSISISGNAILLFGGVYSNLQALEKMKEIAVAEGFTPDRIICNGDIVGYCAQPEESLNFIKDWGIHSITGNVEQQLREGQEDCGCDFVDGTRCDIFSRQWYPYAQQNVSTESVAWLEQMPDFLEFDFAGKKVAVVHGSKSHVSQFVFKSTPWKVKQKEFELTKADVIIGGHCGLPFQDEKNGLLWINPGVIGMPANDGQTDVWYSILSENSGEITVEHHHFSYDHVLANQLMTEKGLPASYAKTLLTGIWDNCDILPEEETKAQGKVIM